MMEITDIESEREELYFHSSFVRKIWEDHKNKLSLQSFREMTRYQIGMKKKLLWMMAAILFCGTSLLTSCTDDDPYVGPTPDEEVEAQLKKMTLREKVGQMFYVRPEALDTTIHYSHSGGIDGDIHYFFTFFLYSALAFFIWAMKASLFCKAQKPMLAAARLLSTSLCQWAPTMTRLLQ